MSRPGIGRVAVSHDLLRDLVVACVALAGSVLLLAHGGFGYADSGSRLDLTGGALAVCSSLPLLIWRRAPVGVFVVAAVASTVLAGMGYNVGIPLGAVTALYLLAASREVTHPWTLRTVGIVVGLPVAFLTAMTAAAGNLVGADLVHSVLPWALAWLAGERTRLRREQIVTLEERVAQAERAVEQERLLAVAQERARIARDLHDSAGRAINVITVRAGAARMRHAQEPQHSLVALTAIEDLARQTVCEIDQLVGSLRDDAAPATAVEEPPGLASLKTLIAHHSDAGLEVTFACSGAARRLTAAVDQATYRIVQEALTNAARHGGGAARVELEFGAMSLRLLVTNPAPTSLDARPSSGHGMIGMHERANLLGGALEADAVNGVFRVQAQLPYAGART